MFTDSINENLEVVRDLLSGLPRDSRARAKHAAVTMESAFNSLRKDHPRDPAVALGAAFAVLVLAQRMLQQDRSDSEEGKGMIQLLS